MTLRFYRGGPEALPGDYFWYAADGRFGCAIANEAGVGEEMEDAYDGPYKYHQHRNLMRFRWEPTGGSDTAILPIEV